MANKRFDLVAIGRAAVDLYGEQLGSPLEDVASFAKSLGGCAANIAVGCARLGLQVAMITRVGDEHMGRFVRAQLAREGVEVSAVRTDPDRLTGLVLLSVRDRNTFPLIFYRERCADMGLVPADVDPELVASSRALLVTGTHFSQAGVDAASRAAITSARGSGTRVVLDLDYRPVLWGLTGHGLGEQRFVESGEVTEHLLSIVEGCDLVVGTEEEIHVAGGSTDTLAALSAIRARTGALIVMKRGPLGCVAFPGAIPTTLDPGLPGDARFFPGVPVEVLNVLGAGDAFLAGFLRGWIRGEPLEEAARYANACGALVVSRHACSPAMPTRVELDDYLSRASEVPRIDLDARVERLHRVTTRARVWPELCVLAFDHRGGLERMATRAGADPRRLVELKSWIARGAVLASRRLGLEGRAGVIIDDRYGAAPLAELTGGGWWIARPIERSADRPIDPASSLAGGTGDISTTHLSSGPLLEWEGGPNLELTLRSWPTEHVVKCLAFYHPDDPAPLKEAQEERLERLYRAAVALGRELLLEIIPMRGDAAEPEVLPRAIEAIYARGIFPDWWKLPPPSSSSTWEELGRVIEREDPHCRGVLVLGLDAPEADLARAFRTASGARISRGFAVGRTIFGPGAERWLAGSISGEELAERIALAFGRLVELFDEARRG